MFRPLNEKVFVAGAMRVRVGANPSAHVETTQTSGPHEVSFPPRTSGKARMEHNITPSHARPLPLLIRDDGASVST